MVMASHTLGTPGRGQQFVRPVGRGDYLAGIGILSFMALFCTALLIRGLAPRGTLWGAADPVVMGAGGGGGAISGGTMTAASLTGAKGAPGTLGTPGAPVGAPGAPGSTPGAPAGGPAASGPAAAAAGVAGAGGASAAASGGGASALGPKDYLPINAPAGYTSGKVEKFDKEQLYVKIDGKADSYVDYGFVGMEFQDLSAGDKNIQVYIYDMGTPLQAFGMLNSERSGTEPAPFGQDGYKAKGSVFFRADRWYVMISVNKEAAGEAAMDVAKQLAAKMPTTKFEAPGLAWFPKDGLVPGSVKWIRKKVGSVEGLDDGYAASYQQGADKVDVFLVRRDDAAALADALGKYKAYLTSLGTVTEFSPGGAKGWLVSPEKDCDMLFEQGKFIGGAMYVAGGKGPAEAVCAKLAKAVGSIK